MDNKTDVLIIGAGLAGLYTALHLSESKTVTIVTKEGFDTSNSWLAQGGIAAVVAKDDTPEFHMEDTFQAGANFCDQQAVKILVDEGPLDIAKLQQWKVPFDLNDEGELAITREGGHTKSRVVHAGGDATGRETVKVLAYLASQKPNINIVPNLFLADLIVQKSAVSATKNISSDFSQNPNKVNNNQLKAHGAVFINQNGEQITYYSECIVLCTGGMGQIFSHTTNPVVATGDGLACCIRHGIELENMEFIQFHPTALYCKQKEERSFLISEAVRGEGAILINHLNERFMTGQHEMGELAPRDIVARGIYNELQKSGEPCVFLDITNHSKQELSERFPTIYNECASRGIFIEQDKIPVCPVQHYMIGGIKTDTFSKTSCENLFAVGETACTGVHGANRLASNSMLECLVFGRRAAEFINKQQFVSESIIYEKSKSIYLTFDSINYKHRIKQICDNGIGVVRTAESLQIGLNELEKLRTEMQKIYSFTKQYIEVLNMLDVATSIFKAASLRKTSIGSHFYKE